MGSQQQTTGNQSSTNALQFNPTAEGFYQGLIGGGSNVLQQYMNNPLSNPFYQLGQSQSQGAASQLGNQAMGVLGQNQKVSGLTGNAGAGWLQAQKGKTGRANMSMMSQANLSNIMQAFNRQMGATGQAMSFSPQITGSTGSGTSSSTTSTSGLGTWLPQLIGSLGGSAMGMFKQSSGAGGGGTGGGTGPTYANNTSILPQGFAGAPVGGSPFGMPMSGNTLGMTNPFAASMMMGPQ